MATVTVRHPAVAGRFYPRNPDDLRAEVENYLRLSETAAPIKAIGCISPHAGYMFSGHVAGAVFARIEVPHRCFVLCPNHTGMGRQLAVMSEGAWGTPLGLVPVDHELAAALRANFPALHDDFAAHRVEHAVEVELPFLQTRQPRLTFVPIALGTRQFEVLDQLGRALAEVVAKQPDPILIVASSDMNHYQSDAVTRAKDQKAIERILSLDPAGLYEVVVQQDISMCGLAPAVAMLTAARHLGAISAELVRYATSGDISGDRAMVVGYAGMVVS